MVTGSGSVRETDAETPVLSASFERHLEVALSAGGAAFGETFGGVGPIKEKGPKTEKEVVMETGPMRLQEREEGPDERRL